MNTNDGGHYDAAIDALAAREYESAANRYTRAGRRILADPREGLDPFTPDENGWIGQGLQCLLVAAVAARVAGAERRATQRAVEGIAITRDLESVLTAPGQRGCLAEFVADFRVAGGVSAADPGYDEAARRYQNAASQIDSPQALGTTPLFEAAAATIAQLARGQANGEIAVAWEDLHGPDPASPGAFLAHRAQYKRQRFANRLDRAVADSHLAAPRGTTEYGNDHHRCPACGSRDVNWAGTQVLCLRCSTPTEEV